MASHKEQGLFPPPSPLCPRPSFELYRGSRYSHVNISTYVAHPLNVQIRATEECKADVAAQANAKKCLTQACFACLVAECPNHSITDLATLLQVQIPSSNFPSPSVNPWLLWAPPTCASIPLDSSGYSEKPRGKRMCQFRHRRHGNKRPRRPCKAKRSFWGP